MIRDWAKSLLFKTAIGAVVLLALLICVETANASDIEVKPSSIDVSFSFDQPIESAHYEKKRSFTIKNTNPDQNSTVSGSIGFISGDISITPNYDSFLLHGGESSSITLTIVASPSASEGTYPFTINVGEEGSLDITVTITHYAKIEVSRSSIDFGRVHRTDNPTETVTISEVYGYKSVYIGAGITGNSWLTATLTGHTVKKGSPVTITFQLNPGQHPDHNRYSWTFFLSTTTGNTEIRPSSIIHIEAYILMPPKLGRLHDEDLEIKFDKPKGTVSKYDRYIDVRVRNEGDETMSFNSWFTEYPSGITIKIENPSGSVSGKSSENIGLHVIAPYDAPEGTYYGRMYIDAGGAGHGNVDITIKIIWPVDFTISSSSPYFTPSPPSIDFESLELKELGYKKKRVNLTLTEFYLYKSVRNLRFSTSGEYGNWLKEELDFSEIPPGESGNITLKIEPGLEAVPKDYSWKYYISAYEISAKRIDVKAKIVPMNIPEMIEYLNSFRESPLHDSYPSSEVIISNGVGMLEVVEESEIGAEDWKKIPVLMKGTLSLLSSLNDGIMSSEEENYGKAVENLVSASVSTSTIGSNSELNNWDISGYAKDISTGADKTTEEVLIDEAKMLELRGWNIKKAVEHAMALDDISRLKEEENVLESALSYQYAATIYGLLNDKEKRIECNYEESLLMDKHDELVSDATGLRIKADKNIMNSRENDLIRIWNTYLLLNPYKYDTFSESYGSAEKYLENALKNYKVAGESLMSVDTEKKLKEVKSEWSYILSLFFIACILYGAAFIYTINRVIMGTVAYMRDMYEREVGDIIVK
uniref:Uncharacterized protein n=1 Tax=Candidatus Methanophagaceae archaeon ANME-1 ERB6 TaxID=2759912 RepID=A0A7G9Z191_9EURY|nr:hypothetical protein KFAGBJAM_00006 [Methanosarcinales archaeon ANME-1 ERB6]